MQTPKIKWIGLKLSPPLLLGIQEEGNQVEEQKVWTKIETNAGFYLHGGTLNEVPWDVREATRAMNELHMDD